MAKKGNENTLKKIGEDGRTLKSQQNKKLALEGMVRFRCIIYKACQYAGINRTTFYDYYRDDQDFKAAIDELSEAQIDEMEDSLSKKTKVDTVANIFWLKCKGRKRGWNERLGIDINPESSMVPNEIIDAAVGAALKAERERLKNAVPE